MTTLRKDAAEIIKRRAGYAARFAGWIAIPAFFIAIIGLSGVGYCDHKARFASSVPDAVHGYTYGVNFKGATRYVSRLDAKICAVSFPIGFSGMGIFILMGGAYFLATGRLPGK